MAQLAETADRLHQPKPCSTNLRFLTHRIAGMTRRARVDRAASMDRLGVLRQMWRGPHRSQHRDEVARVVAFVARVVNANGGESTGTYFHPAVLYPCNMSMRACLEEQFGPVVPIVPFDDEREAIDAVVSSPFGQEAAIFGRDEERVGRLVDALVPQVSRINLNSQCQRGPDTFPFTGRKASAEGTLSVTDALRVFSIRTMVAARDDVANRALVASIVRGRTSSFVSTDFLF